MANLNLQGAAVSRKVGRFPGDDKTNGWSALLAPRAPNAPLAGHQSFDWVVVGAGYAGLAAARRIATNRPNDSIALLDAGEIGENASGRNSGFAIDLPHNHADSAESLIQTRRAIKVGRFALDALDGLISEHQIQCDWSRRGKYHAAVTAAVRDTALRPYAKDLERWGEPFEFLEGATLAQRLGTPYYGSAVYTPGSYLVNPAALCRGLAASLPANVTLFENSAVTEFDFSAKNPFVKTREGLIQFGKLVLTVNAFSAEFGVFKNRQIPIVLFASLTQPLTLAQCERAGLKEEWGVTPAHSVAGATLRFTQDRRLLIRHGFEYSPDFVCGQAQRERAKLVHRELLAKRFPQLSDVAIEHFWMGWLSVSQNQAPAFGKVAENVFAASCCNGVGIVRHTAAGTLIGDLACGVDNELIGDFLSQGVASRLPPRPFLDVGVRLKLLWDVTRGRAEA